jgi:hypothetical protein
MADDVAGDDMGVEAPRDGVPVTHASEVAQARYFAEIMRSELVKVRRDAKEVQQRWAGRRVKDDAAIPERLLRLKRRVREANRVLKLLEARFPGMT